MYKVKIGKSWPLTVGLWLWYCGAAVAQNTDAFVRVEMSPVEVVKKQPIRVKVTAYSSTWFAQPLDFQNVQIPNAFILPFARTQSGIHYVNNKKYAGLEFFFLVFPYQEGEFVFPALGIKTSIPPEGGYVGQPTTLKSSARKFTVSPLPGGVEAPDIVAKNVFISENWSGDLSDIKVGDVLTRKLFIRAKGTLPSFISSVKIDDLDFASVYSKQAELKDERDRMDANGLRTEEHAYLFEREGIFTIPAASISWWNPYVKRKYEKELPAIEIQVKDNPDLGLVGSVRDSLNQLKADKLMEEGEEASWRDMMPLVLRYTVYAIILFLFVWILKRIYARLRAQRDAYLTSEKFYFDQFRKKATISSLYRWYDEYRKTQELPPEIGKVIDTSALEVENWTVIVDQVQGLRKSALHGKPERTVTYTINPR